MEIEEHHKQFKEIITKYNLSDELKADKISHYLTNIDKQNVSANDFANKFSIKEEEAKIFLSFIEKGLKFKEKANI